jgi:hypothetical protein
LLAVDTPIVIELSDQKSEYNNRISPHAEHFHFQLPANEPRMQSLPDRVSFTRTGPTTGSRSLASCLVMMPPIESSKVLCERALMPCAAAKAIQIKSQAVIKQAHEAREDLAAQRLLRTSAELRIFLDLYSFEYLLNRISHRSVGWAALNTARLLGNTRIVECDGIQAHELLLRAREYCPGAIDRIMEAIRIDCDLRHK